MSKLKSRYSQNHGRTENRIIETLDDLREFEELRAALSPEVRKDLLALKNGKISVKEIQEKYKTIAQMVQVMELLNPKNRMAAAQQILDRSEGKPTEKIEQVHKFEKLKDEELDSLLTSRLKEVTEDTADGDEKH